MTSGIDYETHYEKMSDLQLDLDAARKRIAALEGSLRHYGNHVADLRREVSHHRNAATRLDAGLVALAMDRADGPVTEERVAAWFDSRNYTDRTEQGEPVVLRWDGLHEWHRNIIMGAVQNFTRQYV